MSSRRTRSTTLWRRTLTALEREYGRPERTDGRPPLEGLVLGLLKGETSERVAEQALHRLMDLFLDFNEVRVTRPREVAEAVRIVADPEAKALAITGVLQTLFLKRGAVDLDFLTRLPMAQARAFLEQLNGLDGRAVATVLFGLGAATVPADASVVRLARRLGLADRTATPDQVQAAVERAVPAADRYALYTLILRHGERVCQVRTARCRRCGLKVMCVTGTAPKPAARKAKPAASAARKAKAAAPPARKTKAAAPAVRKAKPAAPATRKAKPAVPALRKAKPAAPAARKAKAATPAARKAKSAPRPRPARRPARPAVRKKTVRRRAT